MSERRDQDGMTAAQARRVEYAIIALCIVAIVMIFQPYSMTAFSIGAGLVVLGGLSFNLVPLCQAGVPARALVNAGLIVLGILVVVVVLAMGSTELYTLYLASERQ